MRKSKGKLKNALRQVIIKNNHSKSMGCHKGFLKGKFIVIQAFLKKKRRKISNQQLNLPPKRIRTRINKT